MTPENLPDIAPQHVVLLVTGILIAFLAPSLFRRLRNAELPILNAFPSLNSPIVTNGKPRDQDPNKNRALGEWSAIPFEYPSISSCPKELSQIKPIPYRPFRWGDYHITMGIRNMPWEDWIELDDRFASYHRIRTHRIKTRGTNVVRILPNRPGVVRGGGQATLELVQELAEYLSLRYPTMFQIERHSPREDGETSFVEQGWGGAALIKSISITSLGVTYELNEDPEAMMKVSALLVQDDLALMIEGEDGRYYFQAGAICVAGFWRMQDKIGLPLDEIHTNGNVPQYREKLDTSLARFFRKLAVDKPVIRNNYFIQVVKDKESEAQDVRADATPSEYADLDPEELAWSTTTNGPEDTFIHGHRATPHESSVVSPPNIRFRTERQTLRRLPKSGAILFTIRTYLFPVTELGKERGVPARMASAIRSWPADVAKYKGQTLYRDVLLEYLDECANAQVERGEVEEGEKIKVEYPF